MSESINIGGKTCRLFGSETPACLLVQPSARHENATLEAEATQITALNRIPFVLATIELEDWIIDLMPWPDGNISRDPEAGQHGQETLQYLLLSLIPEMRKRFGPLPVILGGYSLGGLFGLWASTQTDSFRAIAAASPSVWIHGWLPYARKHVTLANQVYLSLGEQEEHVKNQAIARVGDNLRAYHDLLQEQLGPERCPLIWEPGNHFTDNEGRLARAFAWCMTTPDTPVL
ncbi:MAG: esterase [Bacteroidales bacterium]|nr:esterase [Bacteroidales bacterium]